MLVKCFAHIRQSLWEQGTRTLISPLRALGCEYGPGLFIIRPRDCIDKISQIANLYGSSAGAVSLVVKRGRLRSVAQVW
jgi:hypothetical protein